MTAEAYRHAAVEAAPDIFYVAGLDGVLRYVNAAAETLLGYPPCTLVGRDATTLVHPDDLPSLQANLDDYRRGARERSQHRRRFRHGDGSWVELAVHVCVHHLDEGPVLVGSARQIEHELELEARLREANTYLNHLIAASPAAVFRREGPELVTTYISPNLDRVYGWASEELLGQPIAATLERLHPDDRSLSQQQISRALAGDRAEAQLRLRLPDGRYKWVHVVMQPDELAENPPVLLGFVLDIDRQKEAERALERLARYDPLTGLANRSKLEDEVDGQLAIAGHEGHRAALLYLDLNDFKTVNDSWGHAAGDLLLIEVARRLQRVVRAGDTCARLGGDEFVLFLANTDAVGSERTVQRLLRSLRDPIAVEEQMVALDASVGVALYPDDGDTLGELMRKADMAMYRAKREGKRSRFSREG